MKYLVIVFFTVFVAELGDKTQLATLLFATERQANPWFVFLAASAALVTTTAIGVLAGTLAERYLSVIPLKPIAGIAFIVIGAWTLWDHFARAA
jgi:putative Ca2+/H+ antiporter (TMEM165/GDT1 family)